MYLYSAVSNVPVPIPHVCELITDCEYIHVLQLICCWAEHTIQMFWGLVYCDNRMQKWSLVNYVYIIENKIIRYI